jgi:hypothetical protein
VAERVLITTADLEPAVRLRDAFEAEGYAVELLTPGERIADVADPVLLVLTGGLDAGPEAGTPARSRGGAAGQAAGAGPGGQPGTGVTGPAL